ncbi:MAG: hypothetical protein AB8G17_07910 [Gammaproteobacteria bacterium]
MSKPLRACAFVAALLLSFGGCTGSPTFKVANLDLYGERFVRLALDLGQHDADYVDAYHGPEQWQRDAAKEKRALAQIRLSAETSARSLRAARVRGGQNKRRREHLARQFEALAFRSRMLMGEQFTFDEESRGLYDAVAPRHDAVFFQRSLDQLETLLPGAGDITTRYENFRARFVIAPERLDTVFRAAIDECAQRTRRWLELPEDESFTIEYVNDKAWGGYNWFQGGARSLIQVNTDFPIYIDRAVDLACHEGYPGHHVYNTLLEERLLKQRGWIEYSILPLFSPTGLIAEGSANFGIRMAFPADERVAYEKSTLFDLAELNVTDAARYYEVQSIVEKLSYARNEAARRYLDGEIDAIEAADWLVRYALMARDRAEQSMQFVDKYRAYVINYNLGRDLVADWVAKAGEDPEKRWARFEELLSEPYLPSQLVP